MTSNDETVKTENTYIDCILNYENDQLKKHIYFILDIINNKRIAIRR